MMRFTVGPSTKTTTTAWNPKQPFINGCFNWMIPNLYIGNGCFTKHPFSTGCLGFQAGNSGGCTRKIICSTNVAETSVTVAVPGECW